MKTNLFIPAFRHALIAIAGLAMFQSVDVGSAFAQAKDKNMVAETAADSKQELPHFFAVTPQETPLHERIFHLGQDPLEGKITLNGINGFFDRCFQGHHESKIDKENPVHGLNSGKFDYLEKASRTGTTLGTARWHLWVAEPGEIRVEFLMDVPASEASHPWTIQLGDEKQTLKVHATKGPQRQKQVLSFQVKKKGKITFTIDCTELTPPKLTKIFKIQLSGPAIKKAKLLRARWRPSAVHTGFVPVRNAEEIKPGMWVFESKPTNPISSYSPMTTPFGYFGLVFRQGAIAPGTGFNFSMWITNGRATTAPAPELTPRLIGTSLPDASYSFFGHEGTGMKFRNAVAYPNGADRTIQALRIEFDKEANLTTYYGYFYNEDEHRWVLYASGQAPPKRDGHSEVVALRGTTSSASSFCEIPGPPVRERSGDLIRTIQRRGWFYGNDSKWYRAKIAKSKISIRKSAAFEKSILAGNDFPILDVANKKMAPAEDYAANGWITMETGGMEFRSPYSFLATSDVIDPSPMSKEAGVPEYLDPEKVKQLFELPVVFGASTADNVSENSATINCEIEKIGPNSKAVLWYGTVDCVIFSPKKIKKGSDTYKDLFRPERTWQHSTAEQVVEKGANRFALENLKPKTTYYYRLYVEHDEGKSWEYQSGSFSTK